MRIVVFSSEFFLVVLFVGMMVLAELLLYLGFAVSAGKEEKKFIIFSCYFQIAMSILFAQIECHSYLVYQETLFGCTVSVQEKIHPKLR